MAGIVQASVTALDGRSVNLDALKGKAVLIDFWATTCVPCARADTETKIKALLDEK